MTIVLAPAALTALKSLSRAVRLSLLEAMRKHLARGSSRATTNRGRADTIPQAEIARLRGVSRPQYRMRISDIGVFYDVTKTQIQVVAIVPRAKAQAWVGD